MSVKESPWTGYFTLLTRSDGFIVNQASAIITKMACWGKDSMDEQNQHVYVTWLRDQLRIPNNDYTQSVCRCLQILLRIDGYRKVFFEIDGVSAIVNVLSSRVGFQLQYQLTFCLWSTYRNLLENQKDADKQQNALSMVQCKLIKQLEILTDKKFEDEDVVDDIKFLSEFLETSVQDLSSFDEYVTEIKSGRLEWSPVS
ncbi:VhaSFD [Bugula neritina]|uniref:VhaSFD n=1 Tax=Bugula neritina TaxID=10212 RepID=A0A7J7K6E2_BUGNE|nr:VhaSFD [Bugula neritina]